jgi:hypothetical protein
VIPEDLEDAKAAFRLTLRHEQPLSGEYRVFHKNRSILTISIYTRPIFEDGRVVGMQGIIQNITPPPSRFPAPREGLHELIGRSQKMQEIYELIMSVAKTDSTVLIHGESGTGKELIAQAIHVCSHRKNKPFIVVNCAAFPKIYWKANYSAMSADLLPERTVENSDVLSLPKAERSFLMKSEKSRRIARFCSYASCKIEPLNAWAEKKPWKLKYGL